MFQQNFPSGHRNRPTLLILRAATTLMGFIRSISQKEYNFPTDSEGPQLLCRSCQQSNLQPLCGGTKRRRMRICYCRQRRVRIYQGHPEVIGRAGGIEAPLWQHDFHEPFPQSGSKIHSLRSEVKYPFCTRVEGKTHYSVDSAPYSAVP